MGLIFKEDLVEVRTSGPANIGQIRVKSLHWVLEILKFKNLDSLRMFLLGLKGSLAEPRTKSSR